MNERGSRPERGDAPYRVAVCGHDNAVRSLRRGLGSARGAQSYLLTGPPGVGKRTVARYLAQALMCPTVSPGDEPCGTCRPCRLVRDTTFADLHVLEAPVRIEAVRELQHVLALAPAEAPWRVAIVPEMELASIGAANSLLKTLEEPPSHAVLVLTSSAPTRVPATVRSRCRSVTLRPLADATVAAALRDHWGVDSDRAELLAGLADGRLGWAVQATVAEESLVERNLWLDALADVLSSDVPGRLSRAAALVSAHDGVALGVGTWRGWWRDVLFVRLGLDDRLVNRDRGAELAEAARAYGLDDITRSLRLIDEVLDRLAKHANERLAVEVLVLGLPT